MFNRVAVVLLLHTYLLSTDYNFFRWMSSQQKRHYRYHGITASHLPSWRYYHKIFPVPAVITVVTAVLPLSPLPRHPQVCMMSIMATTITDWVSYGDKNVPWRLSSNSIWFDPTRHTIYPMHERKKICCTQQLMSCQKDTLNVSKVDCNTAQLVLHVCNAHAETRSKYWQQIP